MIRRFGSKAVEKFLHLKEMWVLRQGGDEGEIASEVLDPFKEALYEKHGDNYSVVLDNLHSSLKKTMKYTGPSYHNDLKLFHKGEEFFQEMWDRIDSSNSRVWLETYIFVNDYVGQTTIKKLTEAANRGVEVVFLMDAFGSLFATFNKSNFYPIVEAGGFVSTFPNPLGQLYKRILFGRRYISPEVRNHRKLLIIDDTAFIGGMNIENVYGDFHSEEDFKTGETSLSEKELSTNFRDTQLRIEGAESIPYFESCFVESFEDSTPLFSEIEKKKPGIVDRILRKIRFPDFVDSDLISTSLDHETEIMKDDDYIIRDLLESSTSITTDEFQSSESKEEILESSKFLQDNPPIEVDYDEGKLVHKDLFVQIMKSHPHKGRKDLQKAVYAMINASTKYIYITTPYFIPSKDLKKVILNAARRGVNIKILTSGRADVVGYYTTASAVYEEFIKDFENIEIYEYFDKYLHSKVFTMDGIFSSVGSYNFDRMSFKTHLEIGSLVYDTGFSEEIERQFEIDCKNAKFIDFEKWNSERTFFQKLLARIFLFLFTRLFK